MRWRGQADRDAAEGESQMTVIPIGHMDLTRADLAVFMDCGTAMVDCGLAGACVPLETPEGETIIALLDPLEEQPLWVFGKSQGWYYALDGGFQPVAQGKIIDEVLNVLPSDVTGTAFPVAANFG